jgi:AAA family ATP:ADP antiporter
MLCAGILTAQFVAGTATRDALYFAHLSVTSLPQIVIATAIFSIVLVTVTSSTFRKVPPTTFVPLAFAFSGAMFIGEWMLARAAPTLAAQFVYLHVSGFVPVLASGFWLIVTEEFDPRTAKRSFGQIAAVGTLGGVVGGLLADRVAAYLDVVAVLPVLAALSAVSAALIYQLPRPSNRREGYGTLELSPELAPAAPQSGLRVLASTPYLRHLAGLVLLGTMGAVLVDYVFKAHAVAVFGRGDNLLRFFATYYAAISLITFVVQASSSRLILERLGLTVATAMPSAAVMFGGIGALLFPGLPSALAARGSQAVFRGSVFRSGYEVFYTPIGSADKRAAKSIIDVGFDKLGDAAGAGVVRLAQSLALAGQFAAVLAAAVACSALALVVSTRLRRGYILALERSLRDRAVELDLTEVHDVLTRTVVLRAVQQHATVVEPATDSSITARPDTELLAIIELRSCDRVRIVCVLRAADGITAALVPHVIPLLAWDALADEAVRALRAVAEEHVGQFTDALLDQYQPFSIRRRVARVFSACRTQRAVDGLMLGLNDPRFEVRLQCGRSLAAITKVNSSLHIEKAHVFAIVQREAMVSRHVWESRPLLDRVDPEEAEPFAEALATKRATQSLAHVFTVLSLVLPREPLGIAFRGLQTDDERLRGTALEYLELILPQPIHERLAPLFDGSRPAGSTRRSPDTVLAELLKSSDSIQLNLSELARRATVAPTEVTT